MRLALLSVTALSETMRLALLSETMRLALLSETMRLAVLSEYYFHFETYWPNIF
jgi:hypothetical protein